MTLAGKKLFPYVCVEDYNHETFNDIDYDALLEGILNPIADAIRPVIDIDLDVEEAIKEKF